MHTIIELLRAHQVEERIQHAGCQFLARFAGTSSEHQNLILEANEIQAVVAIMETHSHNRHLVIDGCFAISKLANQDRAMVNLGGVNVVQTVTVTMMSRKCLMLTAK
jgi:hypothetical protein